MYGIANSYPLASSGPLSTSPLARIISISQLNIWGYRHLIRRNYDEWHHPSLIRGDPSSCHLISRTNETDTISKQPPAADGLIVGQKMRTMPLYPPTGNTGATDAVPSAVESSSGGPPLVWNTSGGMTSQYLSMSADGVIRMAPGMTPSSLLSHAKKSGWIGSGGYDPFGFHDSMVTLQQGRTENATARQVVSSDAVWNPSPVLNAPLPVPAETAERDDVTGNLFYPVVGDTMDPFDDISIEDPSNPSIEASMLKREMYDGQLLVTSRSQEDEIKKKGTPPPPSLPASKRRRSSELTGNSSNPSKLNEASSELRSSFQGACDRLTRLATLPVGNGNRHSLSLPNGPPSDASAVTASSLAHGMSPAIPSNAMFGNAIFGDAMFDRNDFLLFLDNMIDIVPAAAAAEEATVPVELKVMTHFDHSPAVDGVDGRSGSLS